jgi:hypothetical protein
MESAREEGTAYLTTGDSILGASDVFDGRVFTAGASSGGEVWAGWAGFGFMAWVSGFGVSAGWWRASTGVLAVDGSAATSQHPSIRAEGGGLMRGKGSVGCRRE